MQWKSRESQKVTNEFANNDERPTCTASQFSEGFENYDILSYSLAFVGITLGTKTKTFQKFGNGTLLEGRDTCLQAAKSEATAKYANVTQLDVCAIFTSLSDGEENCFICICKDAGRRIGFA